MTDKTLTRRDLFRTVLRGGFLAGLVGTCAAIAGRDPGEVRCYYTGRCDGCPIELDCGIRRAGEEKK
jgi:hypothetical protein